VYTTIHPAGIEKSRVDFQMAEIEAAILEKVQMFLNKLRQ